MDHPRVSSRQVFAFTSAFAVGATTRMRDCDCLCLHNVSFGRRRQLKDERVVDDQARYCKCYHKAQSCLTICNSYAANKWARLTASLKELAVDGYCCFTAFTAPARCRAPVLPVYKYR